VANHSDLPLTPRITCTAGGVEYSATQTVGPRGSARVAFSPSFDRVGPATAVLRLAEEDALATDDEVRIRVDVLPRRRVVLISDSADDPTTAAFFVARAIAPTGDGRVGLEVVSPDEVALGSVSRRIIWVLCEPGELPTATIEALSARAASGDGIVCIAPADASELLLTGSAPAPQDGLYRLRAPDGDESFVAFEGSAVGELTRQPFARRFRTERMADAMTLLSFDDGVPAVTVSPLGGGRVVALHADISPQRGDVVRSALFVPLVHELLAAATPAAPAPPTPRPGLALDASGRTIERIGEHTLADGRIAWLEVEPEESDLRAASMPTGLAQPEALHTNATDARHGLQLWPYVIAAALLLLGIESLTLVRTAPSQAEEVARA
jgi:hypothetical protein